MELFIQGGVFVMGGSIGISSGGCKGFVDHTIYDTTSILKLIEARYDLKPLGSRDAAAGDLRAALTLGK